MRGQVNPQSDMLCLLSPESRVPQHHPLRQVKVLVDEVLRDLSPLFDQMYAREGRPSIPPERLLKAKVLQALYSIRSEALLIGFQLLTQASHLSHDRRNIFTF